MYLSVIIPAFNEEKRLPETLKKIRNHLQNQKYDWEVLIINDGSKDKTAAVVSELIKNWQARSERSRGGFRLIDNKENCGKGAVVKQGMLEAKGEWRLFMDADNSTDLSEIEKLWEFARQSPQSTGSSRPSEASLPTRSASALDRAPRPARVTLEGHGSLPCEGHYDIIAGSRYLKKDSIKIKQPLIRRMVSRIGNVLIRILLGLNMADTQCGFKMFSVRATKEVFPLQTIERWGFDMEILAISIKKGYKIKEVAVDWYDSTGSQVKKSATLKTLKELLIIKWHLIKGKYS